MKKVFLALIVALVADASVAADLPSRKSPPPILVAPPALLWNGFYAGANVGGGALDKYNRDGYVWSWNGAGWSQGFAWNDNGSSNAGVVGGAQAGYNYQISPLLVVGVETDFQGSSVGGDNRGSFGVTRNVDWFGTVRGRVGASLFSPQLLFYGTGGFAYGDIGLNHGSWAGKLRQTGTGWAAGGGVEWAFLPNWSAKVEYLYVDIGASNWGGYNQIEQRVHLHTVRAGVNYHFNWFAPAPIVAKY